jgi:hypothetical protein
MRKAGIVLGALALVVAGVLGYLQLTRLTRYIASVKENPFRSAELAWLAEHADDVRVQALFGERLAELAKEAQCAYGSKSHVEPVVRGLAKNPPPTSDAFHRQVVALWAHFHEVDLAPLLQRIPDGPLRDGAVVTELHRLAQSSDYRADPCFDRIVGALEARKAAPDAAYADAVVSAGIHYRHAGVARLLDKLAGSPLLPPAVAHGIVEVGTRGWPGKDTLERLKALVQKARPPVDDQVAGAILALWRGGLTEVLDLARALGPGAAQPLRQAVEALNGTPKRAHAQVLLAKLGWGEPVSPADAAREVMAIVEQLRFAQEARERNAMSYERGDYSLLTWAKINDATVESLVALGPAAVAPLKDVLTYNPRDVVGHAARALARLDAAALSARVVQGFDELERSWALFKPKPGEPIGGLASWGYLVTEGMSALVSIEGEAAEVAFLRALASSIPQLSDWAGNVLEKRLGCDRRGDAFFRFLASRSSFSLGTVQAYEQSLAAYGAQVVPSVVASLEALLVKAGNPAKVPWVHKVIAFHVLAKVGDRRAVPVLEKYRADRSSYALTRTAYDRRGEAGKSTSQTIYFATLCDEALRASAAR